MGRGLYLFGSLVSTLLLLMLLSQPAAAANTRVAILPFANDARLTVEEVAYLKTLITGAAATELPDSFGVMTQENLEAMLPPGKTLADCVNECSIETGRNLKVHYVVTGRIIEFGGTLRAAVRVHHTLTSEVIEQIQAKGSSVAEIEEDLLKKAPRLFGAVRRKQAAVDTRHAERVWRRALIATGRLLTSTISTLAIALLIGVDDYHSPGLKDLGGAVRDAKAIGSFLKRGFSITTLLNTQATQKGIQRALRRLIKTVKPQDRVIVFFAGHG